MTQPQGLNAREVNELHRMSDKDYSRESQHHTLGLDPYQASPGNHNHDGRNSLVINNQEYLRDWFVWPPGLSDVGPEYQADTNLLNSWIPADTAGTHGPPGFRRDPTGIVRLRGITKNNVSNNITTESVIATLPLDYRPRDYAEFMCAGVDDFGNSAYARIRINRNGDVVYNGQMSTAGSTAHTWVALDNIQFVAEN